MAGPTCTHPTRRPVRSETTASPSPRYKQATPFPLSCLFMSFSVSASCLRAQNSNYELLNLRTVKGKTKQNKNKQQTILKSRIEDKMMWHRKKKKLHMRRSLAQLGANWYDRSQHKWHEEAARREANWQINTLSDRPINYHSSNRKICCNLIIPWRMTRDRVHQPAFAHLLFAITLSHYYYK